MVVKHGLSYIKGGMQAKVIWKQDPEANIWAQEGWEWGVEKAPQWGVHSLYRSPNVVRFIKSKRLIWTGHASRMEEDRSAFKILTGEPTGKRPWGRSSHRWEENIRMNLKEIDTNTRNWVDSAQDRDCWKALLNSTLNLPVPEAMQLV